MEGAFCFAVHICDISGFLKDMDSLCVAPAPWMAYAVRPAAGRIASMA